MKKLESILLSGCAYAVAIIALFFGFAAISKITEARIGVSQFFLILLFGQIISVAGYILKNASWHFLIRYALHYLTLFLAFCFIFIVNGNIKSSGGSAIFSAIIIFTFFYALVFFFIYILRKSFTAVEKKLPKQPSKNQTSQNKKNNEYTPRFK